MVASSLEREAGIGFGVRLPFGSRYGFVMNSCTRRGRPTLSAARYSLRTFGSFSLRSLPDGSPVPLEPKRLALLVFLASPRPGELRARDDVAGVFWPEASDPDAHNALRQSLHYLDRNLGTGILAGRRRVLIGIEEGAIAYDAADFQAALDAGELETALRTYRGEFLATFRVDGPRELEDWVENRRERLRRQAVGAAVRIATLKEEAGDVATASRWFARALRMAPYDEEILRQRLELLLKRGDPARAMTVYRKFARRLERDLDMLPEVETRRMVMEDGDGNLEITREELRSARKELRNAREELRERKHQLADSRAFLQALLSSARNGVAIVDLELRVVAWNEASEALWGVPSSAAVDRRLEELDIAIPLNDVASPLREVAEGKRRRWETRLEARNRHGRAIRVGVRCVPFVDESGEPRGAVILAEEAEEA